MHRTRVLALCAVLTAAPACDLVVDAGEPLTLGPGGAAFGSSTPFAVSVLPGGTLVVDGADVFGRGQVVDGRRPAVSPSPLSARP